MKDIFIFKPHYRAKQQGFVLIASLTFLVALTAVTSLLMQNSTLDMKMSGASEDKAVAVQEVISSVDKVIYDEMTDNDSRGFQLLMPNYMIADNPVTLLSTDKIKAYVVVNGDQTSIESDCPRQAKASSGLRCNYTRLDVAMKYGRKDKSEIKASAGIAQQIMGNQ